MIQALTLMSVAMLLLAGAVELWWGSEARRRSRKSLAHIAESLAGVVQTPHASASTSAAVTTPLAPGKAYLATDTLCLRAGLAPGWRIPLLLGSIGIAVVALGWWRIGSFWISPLLLALYAAGVGLWIRARVEKLQKKLIQQLPGFLDGLVRLSHIGNSLPMAFQAAMPTVQMPLRSVLDRTMQSARAGLDLDRALQAASRPYRLEELELLHVVLGAGMRMGGRADQILQRMSDFMRDLAQSRQELKAITAETRLSAWVIGLLPLVVAAFMTLTNPAFFMPMFTQPLGHKVLLVALGLELVGGTLLYRLARSL
jgi:tight adherence protein B